MKKNHTNVLMSGVKGDYHNQYYRNEKDLKYIRCLRLLWAVTANEHGVSFWGGEKVLKSDCYHVCKL